VAGAAQTCTYTTCHLFFHAYKAWGIVLLTQSGNCLHHGLGATAEYPVILRWVKNCSYKSPSAHPARLGGNTHLTTVGYKALHTVYFVTEPQEEVGLTALSVQLANQLVQGCGTYTATHNGDLATEAFHRETVSRRSCQV